MNKHKHQRHMALIAPIAMSLLMGACGGNAVAPSIPGDKGGGEGQNRLALTIVTGESEAEEARAYADAVNKVSGGAIEIKVDNTSIAVVPGYEKDVIEYVAAGKSDLGFAASRVFDTVGVKSFVGLQAPFLIDSYTLEEHVLTSDWAKKLLDGTRSAGVVGLGYFQGPMRRPLGLTHDLVDLADYAGAKVGIRASALTEMTIKALGATPVTFDPGDVTGLDGMEAHMGLLVGVDYVDDATSLTGNVIFWPRPGVIFANNAAFDRLTADQQTTLRAAGDAMYAGSVESVTKSAPDALVRLCNRGLKFVSAPDAAIAELRSAVQPVYDEIEKDAGTKATIEAINALRKAQSNRSENVECDLSGAVPSPSKAPSGVASPIDGSWATCVTREEMLSADMDPGEDNPDNFGCSVTTFRKGQMWTLPEGDSLDPSLPSKTFSVEGTSVTIDAPDDNEIWHYSYSIFGDTLTFKKLGGPAPTMFVAKPLHKVPDA